MSWGSSPPPGSAGARRHRPPAGIHLLPLAPLLRDRRLVALGVLVTVVALAALVAGLTDTATPSTVTGVGAGLLLLAFAVAEAAALRQSS